MGRWKVTTAAAAAVISTADMKAFLKVDSSSEDAMIDVLIAAATHHAQNYLEQAFITQTITEKFDSFDAFRLSVHPVASVEEVAYLDSAGDEQTLDSSVYVADTYSRRAVIELANGQTWPTALAQRNAVSIKYVAGYGAAGANVPADIRLAIMQIVADAYNNRQDDVKEIPTSSKYLLDRVNYTYLL